MNSNLKEKKILSRNEGCTEFSDDISCRVLDFITGVSSDIYDLQRFDDWLIYSDWDGGTLNVIFLNSGQKSTVTMELMRPSQFVVNANSPG